jgi:hypothetical protein
MILKIFITVLGTLIATIICLVVVLFTGIEKQENLKRKHFTDSVQAVNGYARVKINPGITPIPFGASNSIEITDTLYIDLTHNDTRQHLVQSGRDIATRYFSTFIKDSGRQVYVNYRHIDSVILTVCYNGASFKTFPGM